jgi:hypothetical protein
MSLLRRSLLVPGRWASYQGRYDYGNFIPTWLKLPQIEPALNGGVEALYTEGLSRQASRHKQRPSRNVPDPNTMTASGTSQNDSPLRRVAVRRKQVGQTARHHHQARSRQKPASESDIRATREVRPARPILMEKAIEPRTLVRGKTASLSGALVRGEVASLPSKAANYNPEPVRGNLPKPSHIGRAAATVIRKRPMPRALPQAKRPTNSPVSVAAHNLSSSMHKPVVSREKWKPQEIGVKEKSAQETLADILQGKLEEQKTLTLRPIKPRHALPNLDGSNMPSASDQPAFQAAAGSAPSSNRGHVQRAASVEPEPPTADAPEKRWHKATPDSNSSGLIKASRRLLSRGASLVFRKPTASANPVEGGAEGSESGAVVRSPGQAPNAGKSRQSQSDSGATRDQRAAPPPVDRVSRQSILRHIPGQVAGGEDPARRNSAKQSSASRISRGPQHRAVDAPLVNGGHEQMTYTSATDGQPPTAPPDASHSHVSNISNKTSTTGSATANDRPEAHRASAEPKKGQEVGKTLSGIHPSQPASSVEPKKGQSVDKATGQASAIQHDANTSRPPDSTAAEQAGHYTQSDKPVASSSPVESQAGTLANRRLKGVLRRSQRLAVQAVQMIFRKPAAGIEEPKRGKTEAIRSNVISAMTSQHRRSQRPPSLFRKPSRAGTSRKESYSGSSGDTAIVSRNGGTKIQKPNATAREDHTSSKDNPSEAPVRANDYVKSAAPPTKAPAVASSTTILPIIVKRTRRLASQTRDMIHRKPAPTYTGEATIETPGLPSERSAHKDSQHPQATSRADAKPHRAISRISRRIVARMPTVMRGKAAIPANSHLEPAHHRETHRQAGRSAASGFTSDKGAASISQDAPAPQQQHAKAREDAGVPATRTIARAVMRSPDESPVKVALGSQILHRRPAQDGASDAIRSTESSAASLVRQAEATRQREAVL